MPRDWLAVRAVRTKPLSGTGSAVYRENTGKTPKTGCRIGVKEPKTVRDRNSLAANSLQDGTGNFGRGFRDILAVNSDF